MSVSKVTFPEAVCVAAFAMRTRFEIMLYDPRRSHADLRAAGEAALTEIADAEALLSAYRPDAPLFRLNNAASDSCGPFPVDPLLFSFLSQAQALAEQTADAFDATLGKRKKVTLNPEEFLITYSCPGVRFDPGGIGKGWGIERAREVLRETGVAHAILHGGTSSVAVVGNGPHEEGWPIALADPLQEDRVLTTWRLWDGDALGVSANYGRTDHIRDPRTGEPVFHTLLSAVAIPSAIVADALSTALLVSGTDTLPHLASVFPTARKLLAVRADGTVVSTG